MQNQRNKSTKYLIIAAASIVVVVILILALKGTGKKQKAINISDYIVGCNYTGKSGEAQITGFELNTVALYEAMGGYDHIEEACRNVMTDKRFSDTERGAFIDLYDYGTLFTLIPGKDNGISNGDEIEISVVRANPFKTEEANKAFYDNLGIRFPSAIYTVNGLLESYRAEMYEPGHETVIATLLPNYVYQQDHLSSWHSVIDVKVRSLAYLTPKGGVSANPCYYFSLSYGVYNSALNTLDTTPRYTSLFIEDVQYSALDGFKLTGLRNVPSDNVKAELEKYDIQTLYSIHQ